MKDIWTNRLSEYLDGELDSAERAALETHLATCGHCYATLGELRQVVARAKSLQDTPPQKDLWADIRAEITEHRDSRLTPARRQAVSRRRFSFSVPQLLAASVALVLLSSGGAWIALRGARQSNEVATDSSRAASLQVVPVSHVWRIRTDAAIADLQESLTLNEGRLDTATVRVVRQNLAIIDRAIAQAQKALRQDPGNIDLNLHLAKTMRQKIELLRRANALAAQS